MELWDLYDKDRIKTGKQMVRGQKIEKGFYRIVVNICIFNSKGEMLIQHRQPFKEGWSNMWDLTAGGSAISGDSSESAIERETLEEIGYPLKLNGKRPSLTINFKEGFGDIYLVNIDLDINNLKLQAEEVSEVKWASCDEILKMIDNNEFIPYHKGLIELLFHMKDHETTRTRLDRNEK